MTNPRIFSNRYEIREEIARGGMADVYLGLDNQLNRNVALKVLFPEFARDPSFVERFRREAKASANLNHPNIVGVYDWGQEDSTYYIVMEYVDGSSVRELIRERGTVSPEDTAAIGSEIASALQFAHEHGVVHRDIKPGNILLTHNGQVKVTDFGIAQAGTSEALTQTGSVMGTATYFSPEQAQGLAVDGRSDVYSLGVVLYEMVCGKPPFSGDNPVSVAYKHVKEPAPLPRQINPRVPEDLERIILHAMDKDVNTRYQSASELRADLERFYRGRPVMAPITALLTEAVDMDRTMATPAAAQTQAVPTTRTGGPTPREKPKKKRGALIAAILIILLGLAGLAYGLHSLLNSTSGKQVRVPNVVGLTREAANSSLNAAGFDVNEELVANNTVPKDQVFDQNPSANSHARKGSAISIKISTGPGQQKIPDLAGQAQADATKVLQDLGLTVQVQLQNSPTVDAGKVMSTSPAAGKKVDQGGTVILIVSNGPQPVAVPDVQNLLESDATNRLGKAGFGTQVIQEASASIAQGRVTRTDPAAGAQAAPGSTIKVYVSSGPPQVSVPNVVGMTQSAATNTLQNAGFVVVSVLAPSSQANNGDVISQSPSANANADKGSTVTITVGQGGSSTSTTS